MIQRLVLTNLLFMLLFGCAMGPKLSTPRTAPSQAPADWFVLTIVDADSQRISPAYAATISIVGSPGFEANVRLRDGRYSLKLAAYTEYRVYVFEGEKQIGSGIITSDESAAVIRILTKSPMPKNKTKTDIDKKNNNGGTTKID